MRFKYYRLVIGESLRVDTLQDAECPSIIGKALISFESELIRKIIENQKNRVGFYKMGNVIRHELSDCFTEYAGTHMLIKATENRRSIHKLLLDWIEKSYLLKVYLFIYDDDFGKIIVDGSTISMSSIVVGINEVLKYFQLRQETVLYVIEMLEFSGYRVEKVETVSGDKKFHKLLKNE
jgi:hypothetical protein